VTSLPFSLIENPDGILQATYNDRPILSYNYFNADVLPEEVPKPYFHPLRTLGGSTVTLCRPNDHPWHKGVGMTLTNVGATNFWGGVTYRKGEGYIWLDNHGRQRHLRRTHLAHDNHGGSWAHDIAWETADNKVLLDENRRLSIRVHPADAYWTLDLEMDLRNATNESLGLGTYEANEELQGSFYTGLFWRIPREFLDHIALRKFRAKGAVFAEGLAKDDEGMHGKPARWIAMHGSIDGRVEPVTVALMDRSAPGVSQPRVFIRKVMVGIGLPFQGPQQLWLAAGEHLRLRYQLVIADGHWEQDRIAEYCGKAAATPVVTDLATGVAT
jgi:hypothetical protein